MTINLINILKIYNTVFSNEIIIIIVNTINICYLNREKYYLI